MWVQSHPSTYQGPHTLKENPLSLHQLSMVPQLGGGAYEPSPIGAGMLTGLFLNGSCTLKHSCSEFMGTMAHPVQKTLS